MTRIAYVLSTFPSLTETFILGEIQELRRRGIPLALFALRRASTSVQQPETRAMTAEVEYAAPVGSWHVLRSNLGWLLSRPARYLSALRLLVGETWRNPVHLAKSLYLFPQAVELADRMLAQQIGHIHAHWATYPTTVAVAISELTGLPFSFTAHAWDVSLIRTFLQEKTRRARFVLTCTAENQAALRTLLPEDQQRKVHLNYHGVAVERLADVTRHPSGSSPVVVACGALFERKGLAYLVRALGTLHRRGREFRCVIIGDGPQRRELETLAVAYGIDGLVSFTGALPQEDVIRHYAGSDVFVLPCIARSLRLIDSEAELSKSLEIWFEGQGRIIQDGIPNVLVEAMAMGLPVVSTPISGIPELIRDGQNGLLVPPRDAVQLADAIERLLLDSALRERLGKAATADVRERFDRARTVEALVDIFVRALAATPTQGHGRLVPARQAMANRGPSA